MFVRDGEVLATKRFVTDRIYRLYKQVFLRSGRKFTFFIVGSSLSSGARVCVCVCIYDSSSETKRMDARAVLSPDARVTNAFAIV